MKDKKAKSKGLNILSLVLSLLLLLACALLIFELTRPYRLPNAVDRLVDSFIDRELPSEEEPQVSLVPMPIVDVGEGALYITPDRQKYEPGTIRLIVPSRGWDYLVGNGTSKAVLDAGPCLYEYSRLPEDEGANVSIAAHRDNYGYEFYYIDKITEGEYLYLIYEGRLYSYLYEDTKVVDPYAWDIISDQDFPCLTLTSCTPLGVASHRIVVRARLQEVVDYSDDMELPASVSN